MIKYEFFCDLPLHPYSTAIVWQLKIHFCLWPTVVATVREGKKCGSPVFQANVNRNELNGINNIPIQNQTEPNSTKSNAKCSTLEFVWLSSTQCVFVGLLVCWCDFVVCIFCTQRTSGRINIIHLFVFTFLNQTEKSAEHSKIMRHIRVNELNQRAQYVHTLFSKQMGFRCVRLVNVLYSRALAFFFNVFGSDECDA